MPIAKVRLAGKYIAWQVICPCGNHGPLAHNPDEANSAAKNAGWLIFDDQLTIGPCCRSINSYLLPSFDVTLEVLEMSG